MFSVSSMMPQRTLSELAQSVRNMLSSMQAQISTAWDVQHNADGTHRDITTPRVRTRQIGLGGIAVVNQGSAITCAPLVVPPRVTVVWVVSNAGATPIDIFGIQQEGVQHGDILAIGPQRTPGGPAGIDIHNRPNGGSPGTTPVGTEITWDLSFNPTTPMNLAPQSFRSPLLLMYLPETGTNLSSAWCVLRGLTP